MSVGASEDSYGAESEGAAEDGTEDENVFGSYAGDGSECSNGEVLGYVVDESAVSDGLDGTVCGPRSSDG